MERPRIRAGGFYFSRGFAARSRALRARISLLRRSPLLRPARQNRHATQAIETADYVQIPWVWPRGVLPKTQKRSNAPHAGHAFATNPLLSPWVARGLPGGRPLGMAADTRIKDLRLAENKTSHIVNMPWQ